MSGRKHGYYIVKLCKLCFPNFYSLNSKLQLIPLLSISMQTS